ncbi:MAG: hypothetical protein JWP35_2242 [Caulobacter sp.]|nr:hypothetical protein [Caulobacter sp.]
MQRWPVLLTASAAVLALAACSKPAGKTASGEAAAPGAAPASTGISAQMGAMPTRAAGLWTQTIHTKDHSQAIKICLDADTDKRMSMWSQGMGMEKCSKNEAHRGLDGTVTFESECDIPPSGHISSKGVAKGDFSSHYTVTIDGTITGAAMKQMNGASSTTIDAVRDGDCPAGWKGGDMEMPGMGKMNIETMQKRAEQLRGLSGQVKFKP